MTNEVESRFESALQQIRRERQAIELAQGPFPILNPIWRKLCGAEIRCRLARWWYTSRIRRGIKTAQYFLFPSTYRESR